MSFFTPFAFVQQTSAAGDPDVNAFFARVTAAGGTLTSTEQAAITTLVSDMKANGIWTPMKAIYPMVGASSAACKQNLKSSSFTGTFNGGWTFASTGVTPNGSTGYFDTTLVPSTDLTFNNISFSLYSRTNFTPSGVDHSYGCSIGGSYLPLVAMLFTSAKAITNCIYSYNSPDVINPGSQNFAAMFTATRTSASSFKVFRNSSQIGSTVTTNNQGSQPNNNFYFGAINLNGTAGQFMADSQAFWSIGDGLSDAQTGDLYTAVQAFNTTLGRQV